jgi:hypothetical protein
MAGSVLKALVCVCSRRLKRCKMLPLGAVERYVDGRLAQLGERLLYTQDVGGSSPSSPTNKIKHLYQISEAKSSQKTRSGRLWEDFYKQTGYSGVSPS